MPTWIAAIAGFGSIVLSLWSLVDAHGRLDAGALALLVCFATFLAAFANLRASLSADRDDRRGAALRAMYGWDWIALGLSASSGGAALLLAGLRSHEFAPGLLIATFATILGLLAAIRHRLVALEPSLANLDEVFR